MGRVLPILFNTEMVRAILLGRKRTTRRLIKESQCNTLGKMEPSECVADKECLKEPWCSMTDKELIKSLYKPPYQPGDILYVRETWAFMPCIACDGEYARTCDGRECHDVRVIYDDGDSIAEGCFIYRAGGDHRRIVWSPSIHMPRQAARIWLRVTDVGAERLQDMDTEDGRNYIAEGATGKSGFIRIWDTTVQESALDRYGWAAAPWVWVIEFEHLHTGMLESGDLPWQEDNSVRNREK
ncbi:MAG: hypothetical protein NC489_25495 [Ruminococcus flavefaciens]|nr:hypothetical protein [Ruminococcus flavefaciens]